MINKPIRLCEHLEHRLALRKIDRQLPEQIIRRAEQRFKDVVTNYEIAVATVPYGHLNHLMMVVFEERADEIVAVTIHPLSERDVQQKIKNGRWEYDRT